MGDFFKSDTLVPLDKHIADAQSAGKIDMKKFYFPPYAIAAEHYWPDKK